MTTLAGIRRKMLELEPSLGEVYNVTSLAAQTLTVSALATGQVQSGKYVGKWMLRPYAADAANRNPRIASNFSSSTGVLTHTGAAYTDTTATDEIVELHEYDPVKVDLTVQRALETCRFRDEAILPVNASGFYWLDGYDWIVEPSDIYEVRHDAFPILSNNRYLQQWNGYDSSGNLVPDYFDLTGTFIRGAGSRRGKWTLVTPNSSWEVEQGVGLLEVDVDLSTLRTRTVTAVLVASTSVGGQASVTVDDGDSTTVSDFIPAGGARTEVVAQHVISEDASKLTFRATGSATTTIEELYLCYGAVNNGIRVGFTRTLKTWPGWALNWQQGQPLRMDTLGLKGYGSRLILVSQRPYTPFVPNRVAAGTADQDETDAPVDLIAKAALALFFEDRANAREGTEHDARRAAYWQPRADSARAQHLATSDGPGFNDTILSQRGSGVAARGIR